MFSKQVTDFVKLGDMIKAYGNGMFLTVNYSVMVHENYKSREEYRFQLVLQDSQYKRIKHWFFDDTRLHSKTLTKEFTMAQVADCKKYWRKMRDTKFPEPVFEEW